MKRLIYFLLGFIAGAYLVYNHKEDMNDKELHQWAYEFSKEKVGQGKKIVEEATKEIKKEIEDAEQAMADEIIENNEM